MDNETRNNYNYDMLFINFNEKLPADMKPSKEMVLEFPLIEGDYNTEYISQLVNLLSIGLTGKSLLKISDTKISQIENPPYNTIAKYTCKTTISRLDGGYMFTTKRILQQSICNFVRNIGHDLLDGIIKNYEGKAYNSLTSQLYKIELLITGSDTIILVEELKKYTTETAKKIECVNNLDLRFAIGSDIDDNFSIFSLELVFIE